MKKKLVTILLFCILVSITSCGVNKTNKPVKLNLYYNNKDNSKIITEQREVEITEDKSVAQVAMEELLKGPSNPELISNIPKNTKLLNIDIKDETAVVNLSNHFKNFPDSTAERFAIISIVNTLTGLPGIDKVRILIEGENLTALSGKPYDTLKKYNIESINEELNTETETITLYFPDEQAMYLVPEHRDVVVNKPIENIIVEELIKGPKAPGRFGAIPEGTKLISIEIKDKIAYVNFSKEFKENHPGGSTGEMMTINSVVNSLTELPEIDKVQFLIEGKKEETLAGHVIFNEPFDRNESIIKR